MEDIGDECDLMKFGGLAQDDREENNINMCSVDQACNTLLKNMVTFILNKESA